MDILAKTTMVLHPMCGDVEHIVKIKRVLMFLTRHCYILFAIYRVWFLGFNKYSEN